MRIVQNHQDQEREVQLQNLLHNYLKSDRARQGGANEARPLLLGKEMVQQAKLFLKGIRRQEVL